MSAEPIQFRVSCLLARAEACAAGFDRLGKDFSASFTRENIIAPLRCGLPAALYEHFVGQQEELLAGYLYADHAKRELAAAIDVLENGRG